MSAQWESLEQAMRSERLRMHGVIVVTSSAASAVLCLVVAGALWGHVAQAALMYWVAAVAAAIALRLSVGLGHRRSGANRKPEMTWLFRYRASFAVHGMAWGLAGWIMLPQAGPLQQDAIVFALAAVTAGSLITASFDTLATLLFSFAALAPALQRLASEGDPKSSATIVMLALLAVMSLLTARRSLAAVREALVLRLSEAERARELQRTAQLLDSTNALALVGGWELDLSADVLRWSTGTFRLHDLTPGAQPSLEEALGHYTPASRAVLEPALAHARSAGTPFDLDLTLVTAQGREIEVHVTCQSHVEDGRVVRLIGAIQDVTRLRATDRALAEKHHLLDQLLQSTRQGFWFIDNQGISNDLNPAMCELLGRPREHILGRSVFEFFDGADLQVIHDEIASRQRGKTGGYEIGIARPDGSRVHCFNNATPIYDTQGQRTGSIGIWTDITERRQAEQALRTYELVANSITDMVSVVGEDSVYRMVNDAWCRVSGVPRASALGRHARDAFPAAASPERRQALDDCIRLQEQRVVRGVLERPGQEGRHVETTYYPYAEVDRGVRCVVLVSRDVTQEEHARQQLAAATEYLQRTLNATGDAIFATDANTAEQPVRFVNDQMLQMWGIPPEKAAMLTSADIMAYATDLFADPVEEARLVVQIIDKNQAHESRVRLRDGRVLLRRCLPAQVGDRTLRVWSFRDVTAEQLALQSALDSDAEQRALLDAFPGFIGRLDENLRYTYVNDRLAALLGTTPAQMLGRSVREVSGADWEARLLEVLPTALAGGKAVIERHHDRTAERSEADVQITLAAGSDARSGARILFTFGADITGLKQSEQALRTSESELRGLLQAFPGYIAAVDQDYVYSYVNDRLAAVLGRPASEIIGRHVRDVLGEERFRLNEVDILRAKAHERTVALRSYPATATRPRLDLEVTHVVGALLPGGLQTAYAFGQDITARLRAEEELKAARDEAERANRAKSQFLSQMSHELRTPMNAIMGFGQLLQADQQHPLADEQKTYLREILRGARHLLVLINEVLDLGRVESGKLDIDLVPVNLRQLGEECLTLVRPLALEHGVRIDPLDEARLDCQVLADRVRLKQVLINLLSNAIKYNKPAGKVALECLADAQHLRIAVRDTGPGLTTEQQARLFQPFERLDPDKTGIEGTGIGLALSRRLTEAMDGDIGVDSEPGVGSVFWVRLPRARAPAAVPSPSAGAPLLPATSASSPLEHKVLYVEDNPVNMMVMEAMLSSLDGVRLIPAALPAEGLSLAQSELPDLILLDIQLPGMDGYEVLRRLRTKAATRNTPIVAVSANAMPSDIETGLTAGFSAYLTKPLEMEVLLSTVRQLLTSPPP